LSITLRYNPAWCPEGVAEEDLVVAYFDVVGQEWVPLPSTVDTEDNIIRAGVSGFTMVAILAEGGPQGR